MAKPLPQRALRAPMRPAARVVADAEHLTNLTPHLSPRDRWIARLLYEHRVLTTHQLVQAGWPTRRTANERLLQLYRWRVIDRFQPLSPVGEGMPPAHYVCDVAGAAILAAEDGVDLASTGYRHERALGVAYWPQLAHRLAVNGFFTHLIAHARRPDPAGTLTAWWSETRTRAAFGDIVRPDAYGRWTSRGTDLEWFLELDWATEPYGRLAAKIDKYGRLATATGITTPVLFWFPTAGRETRARRALADAVAGLDQPHTVPVATTAATLALPDDQLDPAPARWLPLTSSGAGRLTLDQLPRAWPRLPAPAPVSDRPDVIPAGSGLRPPAPMPPEKYRG
ncbi:Replication-relaxation [Parafrankia irregularis]|uniref:Replication-relaxation n=1 Tax=Parafrankia irregularis TaxID=795642 RepID=A0A0S4R020_9ACTN|nr:MULTISPECIES: replication-relaxation family protein [Parafrankia]MBE3200420.1 replication-relaxation family protein [Parafrankia sp. CH37]CUU60718.1 Replication-relaxation [Parafrankia irregularis]